MACRRHRSSSEPVLSAEQQAATRQALDIKDMSALAGLFSTMETARLSEVRLASQFGKPQALGAGLYGFVAV